MLASSSPKGEKLELIFCWTQSRPSLLSYLRRDQWTQSRPSLLSYIIRRDQWLIQTSGFFHLWLEKSTSADAYSEGQSSCRVQGTGHNSLTESSTEMMLGGRLSLKSAHFCLKSIPCLPSASHCSHVSHQYPSPAAEDGRTTARAKPPCLPAPSSSGSVLPEVLTPDVEQK